jgi:TolA-binding protein
MKKTVIFVLLAMFVILRSPVTASPSADYKKACDLIRKEKLQEAANILAPIAADPTFVLSDYAEYRLAQILQESGNIESAKEEYLALSERYPGSILRDKACYNLGAIYMSEKDFWNASKEFVKLIQSKPFNVPVEEARRQAGIANRKLGLVMSQEASADSLFERGAFLLDKKDYAGAAASFEKFFALYPSDTKVPEAILRLGMCYYRAKMYDEAVGLFEKVKNYFPEAYYYMGFAYWKRGDSAKAFEFFDRLSADYPESELAADAKYWRESASDDAVWEMGFNNYKNGKYKEAYNILGESYEKDEAKDTVPRCLFWQAKSAEKLGWSDVAEKLYRKTAERFPYTYYGYRALAKLHMDLPFVDVSKIEPKQEIAIENPHFDKYKELFALGFYDDAVNEANAVEKQENSQDMFGKSSCRQKAMGRFYQAG